MTSRKERQWPEAAEAARVGAPAEATRRPYPILPIAGVQFVYFLGPFPIKKTRRYDSWQLRTVEMRARRLAGPSRHTWLLIKGLLHHYASAALKMAAVRLAPKVREGNSLDEEMRKLRDQLYLCLNHSCKP